MPAFKFILTPLLLLIFFEGYSQELINKSRENVLKKLNSYEKKEKINTIILQNDSCVIFQLRDTGWQNLDKHFYFNEKGKCYKEVLKANCDSCFQMYLTKALKINMYKWQKISSLKYLSNYSWQLLLAIDPQLEFTFSIQKLKLTKEEFNRLRKG